MFLMLFWVYIHTEQAEKLEPATLGYQSNVLPTALRGQVCSSVRYFILVPRPQSHFHSVARWKFGSGLDDLSQKTAISQKLNNFR
jgi:hypothetical protein